jgi:hypothetical protein
MSPKQKVPSPASDKDDMPNRGAQRKRGSGHSGVDENQSTLVSPVGNMGLQSSQEGISIRSKSADSTTNPEIPFSGLPRSNAGSTRSIITSSSYQQQYVQPAPMEEPPQFIGGQSMNMPAGYSYMPRSNFGPPSPVLPMRRSHTFHSTPPPPPGIYEGWSPQMPNSLMGNQMFNAYGAGPNTPPSQPSGPSQYQLLPPLSGAALPPLHQQHQPAQDIVTDRPPQQYEQGMPHSQLRAQSLSHPHQPGHGMLDYQSFPTSRAYGNMGGSEPTSGMVDDMKRERMGGN